MTVDELNALDVDAAERELSRCCGSPRWALAMALRRPFRGVDELYHVADDIWWSLKNEDWLEAFAHHPRIGERAVGWAKDEQAGTRGASSATLDRLIALNHEYERKFGHVFLIFATGKSADGMLAELRRRLTNDSEVELRTAAGEQAKITRLRLEKLLSSPFESSRTR